MARPTVKPIKSPKQKQDDQPTVLIDKLKKTKLCLIFVAFLDNFG